MEPLRYTNFYTDLFDGAFTALRNTYNVKGALQQVQLRFPTSAKFVLSEIVFSYQIGCGPRGVAHIVASNEYNCLFSFENLAIYAQANSDDTIITLSTHTKANEALLKPLTTGGHLTKGLDRNIEETIMLKRFFNGRFIYTLN